MSFYRSGKSASGSGLSRPGASGIGFKKSLLGVHGAVAVPNTMSIDGSCNANDINAAVAAGLTTTKSNNVIVAFVLTNGGPVNSVSSPTLGTFTRRSSAGFGVNAIEEWWAIANSPLTNETIIATASTSAFITMAAFAVNGAKTSAPFDTNASLTSLGISDPVALSTNAVNTMVLGAFRMSTATPTPGAGYTQIAPLPNGFMLVEYKLASAPQSGLSVTVGTGAGTVNGAIGDALVQGP